MPENTIHTRIKKLMETQGLNYRSFGNILDYSDVVVRNIITERNKPSYDFIEKLTQTFDWVSVEWLLTGEGSMFNEDNKEIKPTGSCELCKIKDQLIKSQEQTIELLRKEVERH